MREVEVVHTGDKNMMTMMTIDDPHQVDPPQGDPSQGDGDPPLDKETTDLLFMHIKLA